MPQDALALEIPNLLEEIQKSLFAKAKARLEAGCRSASSYDEFKKVVGEQGGFVFAPWCGSRECETRVSEETKATLRLIPDRAEDAPACMVCGKGPARRVPFAVSY
jgi:prolyl-tRNA synthetase